MDNKEIKERIVEILDRTFKIIDQCYTYNDESKNTANFKKAKSRIIFPSYNDEKERRISEQELRFLFIEEFNRYCRKSGWDAYYSVETPTRDTYRFPKNGEPDRADDGRSARIDVCIHNKDGKRLCLLEFKALNPSKNSYIKDLKKLAKEKIKLAEDPSYISNDGLVSFFVQLLENRDSGTSYNILKKIKDNIEDSFYVCHTMGSVPSIKSPKTQYLTNSIIKQKDWERMRSEKEQ